VGNTLQYGLSLRSSVAKGESERGCRPFGVSRVELPPTSMGQTDGLERCTVRGDTTATMDSKWQPSKQGARKERTT